MKRPPPGLGSGHDLGWGHEIEPRILLSVECGWDSLPPSSPSLSAPLSALSPPEATPVRKRVSSAQCLTGMAPRQGGSLKVQFLVRLTTVDLKFIFNILILLTLERRVFVFGER